MVEWFGRPEIETDEVRERRITVEAVVDAYNEQERAVGWYYYLEGKLNFPFLSHCATRRSTSPLKVGDEVEVIGMAPAEDCEHDMFVEMNWDEESLAVPLSQLEVIDADDQTREAVEDWLYWIKKGYQSRKASTTAFGGRSAGPRGQLSALAPPCFSQAFEKGRGLRSEAEPTAACLTVLGR